NYNSCSRAWGRNEKPSQIVARCAPVPRDSASTSGETAFSSESRAQLTISHDGTRSTRTGRLSTYFSGFTGSGSSGAFSAAAGRALAGRHADVGYFAGGLQRHVEALVTFEPVDRDMVGLADRCQVGPVLGAFRRTNSAP